MLINGPMETLGVFRFMGRYYYLRVETPFFLARNEESDLKCMRYSLMEIDNKPAICVITLFDASQGSRGLP